jgi:uncharacterized protein YfcZ (UPF0381/DUF406 family)
MSMQTERYPAMLSPSVVPSIVPKLNIIKGLESLDLEDVGEPPASAVASPPTSPRHQGLAGGSAGESARLFWSRDDQESGAQVGKVAFNVAKDPTTSTITSTANSSMVDPCFRHPSSPLSRNITAAIPEHEAHRPRDTLTGNRRRRHRGATDALPCVSGHPSTVIDRAERLRSVTDLVTEQKAAQAAAKAMAEVARQARSTAAQAKADLQSCLDECDRIEQELWAKIQVSDPST